MSDVNFRKPTQCDIKFVATNMRAEDRVEVLATSNRSPLEALVRSVNISETSVTVLHGETPLAILGVYVPNLLGDTAAPWLLASDFALEHRREFLRLSRPYVRSILQRYSYLYNYVHVDNSLSIRWLKWIGFQIAEEPIQYGVNKALFYKFDMRA